MKQFIIICFDVKKINFNIHYIFHNFTFDGIFMYCTDSRIMNLVYISIVLKNKTIIFLLFGAA